MRYIYVDEAGINAKEPVTIVVGIIVHADTHWRLAESKVKEVLQAVPEHHRANFIFHATAIRSDVKLREGWSMEGRLALLHAMMSLPRQLNLAISIGLVWRKSPVPQNLTKVSPVQFQHIMAFHECVSQADRYIRVYGGPDEVATVIAEDTPDIRDFIRRVVKLPPVTLTPDEVIPTQAERAAGVIKQDRTIKISQVIDSVHFVAKEDGPLLQIADACAFGFRRYFSGQAQGEDFVRLILGYNLIAEDWAGPSSGGVFYWHPRVKK